jgi:hypothetical protein
MREALRDGGSMEKSFKSKSVKAAFEKAAKFADSIFEIAEGVQTVCIDAIPPKGDSEKWEVTVKW